MDLSIIKISIVKTALEALQEGDQNKWVNCFTKDVVLTDDGNQRDFYNFTRHALGREKFIQIYKLEKDGLAVYGRLSTPQWGDFDAYFEFHINKDHLIYQLDTGQLKHSPVVNKHELQQK